MQRSENVDYLGYLVSDWQVAGLSPERGGPEATYDLYSRFPEMHRALFVYIYKQAEDRPKRMAEEMCNSVQSNVTLCRLFEEDAVTATRDGQYRCGVVLESSEYVSSDEDGDEDICADYKLRRGTVRVAWHPEGTEEVVDENTVNLYLVSRHRNSYIVHVIAVMYLLQFLKAIFHEHC